MFARRFVRAKGVYGMFVITDTVCLRVDQKCIINRYA